MQNPNSPLRSPESGEEPSDVEDPVELEEPIEDGDADAQPT